MKRIRLVIGLAVLFSALFFAPPFLSSALKEGYATVTKPLYSALTDVAGGVSWFFTIPQLSSENKLLKTKLDNFRRLLSEHKELEIENARLRDLIGFKNRLSLSLRRAIPCQVIGRSPAGWRESVVIDRGRSEGIRVNMPVMTYAGLAGKVSEVTAHVSKVKLITHPRFRIGALVQRTRHTGVVFGTADGECRMKYIALDADVKLGDSVETAGSLQQFPKGLLIGTIDAIWKEPGQLYRVASISLAADLDRLEEVLCVVP